jgi:non-canonical (house-cleaning) NTP pyrophosphatase
MPGVRLLASASKGLKVLVASENHVKIEAVRQAFSLALPKTLLHVEGAPSYRELGPLAKASRQKHIESCQ